MKKIINLIIIAVAAVVFVLGVAAMFTTYSATNSKSQATYDKDGRGIVTYDVAAENEDYYVKKTDIEFIRHSESYKRQLKNSKIYLDKAKEKYESDQTDANKNAYNSRLTSYQSTKNSAQSFNQILYLSVTSVFFGTYLPIIAILSIVFIINTKINYRGKEDNRKAE